MHTSTKTAAIVILTSVVLTAYGGAPSESDMKEALEKQMKIEMNASKSFMGGAGADMAAKLMPKIEGLKKIGCKEDGEKAYRCDVELEVSQDGRINKGPGNMRFVKGSEGWMASAK
jgi:hypothetical protein